MLVLDAGGSIVSLIPARWNGELASGLGRARYLLLVGELDILYLCESVD